MDNETDGSLRPHQSEWLVLVLSLYDSIYKTANQNCNEIKQNGGIMELFDERSELEVLRRWKIYFYLLFQGPLPCTFYFLRPHNTIRD